MSTWRGNFDGCSRCAWALAIVLVSGCYRGTKLVTVTFTERGGSSEHWVCAARDGAKVASCHGPREGEIDPLTYDPEMDVLAPPAECAHGVAKMEIVVRRNEVLRVGYECAMPQQPTGLPEGSTAGSSLPPTPSTLPGSDTPATSNASAITGAP